jgi:uroporphyrinogen decarboxylase
VLGFVGAPFTLCSYLIDAPRSRDLIEIKTFMWRYPDAWHELADFWATHMADFGIAQHEAGAAAIQVFDSWAGALGVEDYERYVLPHTARLLDMLDDAGVPSINFAIGNPALLPLIAEAGGDASAWTGGCPSTKRGASSVTTARFREISIRPSCLRSRDIAIERARDILQRVGGRPGHIFNCGHGLHPETDPDVVKAVVDFVHDFTARD